MNIAILSRGPQLYSTQSLYRAGILRGHTMRIIDHTRCNLVINRGGTQIYFDDNRLNRIDAIIPRIGASVTSQGAAVINQFEMMNVFTVAKADALLESRDKLRCLQKLSRCGIDIPRTVFAVPGQEITHLIDLVGGLPVVIKLMESTHGIGVLLAETYRTAEATIEAFQKLGSRIILQEFIREARGTDIRAFVVAGQIVATMKRQAKAGEFRSNLHRGATSTVAHLTEKENQLVKKSVRMMGLDVAGVDLLRSSRGPLVMEVNASPGLEGIEATTGVDIAGKIIDFVEQRVDQLNNYRSNIQNKRGDK